jgi:hypothetical protein
MTDLPRYLLGKGESGIKLAANNWSISNNTVINQFTPTGGTGSVAVTVDNAPTGLGSGVGYSVAQGGSITLSYSTAPTWVWVAN